MAIERIDYRAGLIAARGALVWNDTMAAPRPLLLVMPNWLGVTETAIATAQRLAGDDYVAFVGDMYGEGRTAAGPPESQALIDAVKADADERRARVSAALDTLVAQATRRGIGDSARKAAIGFCFGGANVLELARSGADFAAGVSLHGDLANDRPAAKGDIKAALFILHGSKDPVSPKADRDALERELDAAEARWQMLDFGGVLHAYTDETVHVPGVAAYDRGATWQSYRMAHDFIQDAFAGRLGA